MKNPTNDKIKSVSGQIRRGSEKREPADPLIGQLIAQRYKVLKVLGKGGFGVVYLVEHVALEKKCALKFLYPHMVREQTFLERFQREAKATCRIGHKNIIDIDFGNERDLGYYFVMEYLDGETLHSRLKKNGPESLSFCLHIGLQIANALATTHEKGIIHPRARRGSDRPPPGRRAASGWPPPR